MKKTFLVLMTAAAVVIGFNSCDMKGGGNAAGEKNKEAVKKVMAAWESGNPEGLENYVAADCKEHTAPPGMETEAQGLEGLKKMIAMNHTAYPDMKVTLIDMVAEGDLVVAHMKMVGTNSGPWGPMPATGKPIEINGVDIVRFNAEGKAIEHWGYVEEGKMMTQLGLMPPMGAPAPADTTAAKVEEKKTS